MPEQIERSGQGRFRRGGRNRPRLVSPSCATTCRSARNRMGWIQLPTGLILRVPTRSLEQTSPAKHTRSLPCSILSPSSQESPEARGGHAKAGKNRVHVRGVEMPHRHFGKHIAKIRGQRQVAAFVKPILTEAGPTPIDLSAPYGTAEREHDGGVTMIRAAIAVLPRRAAKLGHAEHQHLGHAIA